MTTARIVAAQHQRAKGTDHIYNLHLSNGDAGEYFAKNGIVPFEVGDAINYKIEPSRFSNQPPHIKLLPVNSFRDDELPAVPASNGHGKQASIWQNSRKSAEEEAMISAIAICKSALEGRGLTPDKVKEFITEMYNFFLNFKPITI